jgi:hypothetical protein
MSKSTLKRRRPRCMVFLAKSFMIMLRSLAKTFLGSALLRKLISNPISLTQKVKIIRSPEHRSESQSAEGAEMLLILLHKEETASNRTVSNSALDNAAHQTYV